MKIPVYPCRPMRYIDCWDDITRVVVGSAFLSKEEYNMHFAGDSYRASVVCKLDESGHRFKGTVKYWAYICNNWAVIGKSYSYGHTSLPL